MNITKTKTITKNYDIYDCAKWSMTIGDTILKRKQAGMESRGYNKCFSCECKLEHDYIPYLALIRNSANQFICEDCARKVNAKRVKIGGKN